MSLFCDSGVHVLADGQYGSCGKGALASWLAHKAIEEEVGFHAVVSNAGPNSGHTFYHEGMKHVLKQLPTFGVQSYLLGHGYPIYLTAGAIIDPHILLQEIGRYPGIQVYVHPCAGVVNEENKRTELETDSIAAVSGTRSGAGVALIHKIERRVDATVGGSGWLHQWPSYDEQQIDPARNRIFMEISQGFSLGLNDQRFYPKVTSRECTFSQGFADARIAPRYFARGYLAFRTFPIRVGSTPQGSSGGWYPDQRETTWEDLGQSPEITTVTQRVRRVATWSWMQFNGAMNANRPTHVFLNFLNYLRPRARGEFWDMHEMIRKDRYERYDFIGGYGPTKDDIRIVNCDSDSEQLSAIRERHSEIRGRYGVQTSKERP